MVNVGLTESLVKVFEGDGSVKVCVELLKGQLGDNLSLVIEVDSRNKSGMSQLILIPSNKVTKLGLIGGYCCLKSNLC